MPRAPRVRRRPPTRDCWKRRTARRNGGGRREPYLSALPPHRAGSVVREPHRRGNHSQRDRVRARDLPNSGPRLRRGASDGQRSVPRLLHGGDHDPHSGLRPAPMGVLPQRLERVRLCNHLRRLSARRARECHFRPAAAGLRLFTLLPDMRILVAGMVRSFRPLGGLALLFAMVFYVYGMLGWILFSDVDPAHWRNIGRALLTMFQLVTVEGWYEVQDAALASEPWAWVYFVSFVIISAFVLFNMVIGVVINSMEEARDHANTEAKAAHRAELAASSDPSTELVKRLDALQEAITDLRAQLEATPNDRDDATLPARRASPTSGTS